MSCNRLPIELAKFTFDELLYDIATAGNLEFMGQAHLPVGCPKTSVNTVQLWLWSVVVVVCVRARMHVCVLVCARLAARLDIIISIFTSVTPYIYNARYLHGHSALVISMRNAKTCIL